MKFLNQFCTATALCAASLLAVPANGQVIRNDDLIGNGGAYGPPSGFAPHAFIEPMIYEVGRNAALEINGDFTAGVNYARSGELDPQTGASLNGTVSGTLRQASPMGWIYGGTVRATGGVVYTHEAADPLSYNFTPEGVDAYVFAETPTLDVILGRIISETVSVPEVRGMATLTGVMDSGTADFSTGVRGDLVGVVSTHQGPWLATLGVDRHNRQHGSVVWKRPVRTITPAYGVEFIRDGAYDLGSRPLTGDFVSHEGQLYGGRAGAMVEYGRLTLGASVGLESFYDGSNRLETQSIYDVGASNKSGRYTFGVGAQHRRSHQHDIHNSSINTDMTIAIATGVDLEVGYRFSRLEDASLADPVHSHEGTADIRLSF